MTSENDKVLMDCYGVTAAQKTIYFYKEYRYDNLSDALNYARMSADQAAEASRDVDKRSEVSRRLKRPGRLEL